MFVSESHLPQMLPPEAYFSDEWYAREREAILRRTWWAVALVQQFRRDGDFVTMDHVDGPIIVRRSGGVIRAYRNVCAHRLAKLTGCSRGNCPVLRCDYHGWEFDDSGATRRIPDAPNFRPLEKGKLGLDVLRVETVGAVVFVSFVSDPPPVREWLAGEAESLEQDCGDCDSLLWCHDIDIPVNWKTVLEINLESYHVGTVHARTLGASPEEEVCRHELAAGGSRFEARGDASAWRTIQQRLAAALGRPADGGYLHVHVHPTFMRVRADLGAGFQSVVPTGPRSCRVMFRSLAWQSASGGMARNAVARLMTRGALGAWKRVIGEDLAILPHVQAGLESPRHPGHGLISRREERLVHFQRWLLAHLEGSAVHGPRDVVSIGKGAG